MLIVFRLAAFSYAALTPAPSGRRAWGLQDRHTLTNEEAVKLIKADKFNAKINDIKMFCKASGRSSLQNDKPVIVYVDFPRNTSFRPSSPSSKSCRARAFKEA